MNKGTLEAKQDEKNRRSNHDNMHAERWLVFILPPSAFILITSCHPYFFKSGHSLFATGPTASAAGIT